MAAGAGAPDVIFSLISVCITHNDIGVGNKQQLNFL